MNKYYLLVYLLFLSILSSCSNIGLTKKNIDESRALASINVDGCKSLLTNYFKNLKKTNLIENNFVYFKIPFTLKPTGHPFDDDYIELLMGGLRANYPSVTSEKIIKELDDNQGNIISYKITISDKSGFEIIRKSEGHMKKAMYELRYSNKDRLLGSEFYIDSLSIMLNKKMLRLKLGNLKSSHLFEKLRTDLMLNTIHNNFLRLQRSFNHGSKVELGVTIEKVLKNISDFKEQIYSSYDRLLIDNFMELSIELTRLQGIYKRHSFEKLRSHKPVLLKIKELIRKIRNFSFAKIRKKNREIIAENTALYNLKLSKIQKMEINHFENKEIFEEYLTQYIVLKEMGDESTVITHLLPTMEYSKFYSWYISKVKPSNDEILGTNITIRDYFLELAEQYGEYNQRHPSWSLFKSKADKKLFVAMDDELQRVSSRKYLSAVTKKIADLDSNVDFKRQINIATFNLKSFEPKVNHVGFTKWLDEKGIPTASDFNKIKENYPNYTISDYLKIKYYEYAPYAKYDQQLKLPFFTREFNNLKKRFGRMKSKVKNCKGAVGCINEIFLTDFKKMFKKDYWSERFSCLIREDLYKNTIYDFALFSAGIVSYNLGSDAERFPWELIASALTFDAFHGEVNCRFSKKPLREVGALIDLKKLKVEKNIRRQFFIESNKKLVITALYSSLGFTMYNLGINNMYIALGYPLSENISLKDAVKLYAFNAIYFATFSPIKKLLFDLPLRHKILPKVVALLQKKFPGRLSNGVVLSSFYNRTLESGFYFGMSYINTYLYLDLYKQVVMPWLMKYFSIEIDGYQKTEISFYTRKLLALGPSESMWEGKIDYQNGIKSKVLYKEKIEKENSSTSRFPLSASFEMSEEAKERLYLELLTAIGEHLKVVNIDGEDQIQIIKPNE